MVDLFHLLSDDYLYNNSHLMYFHEVIHNYPIQSYIYHKKMDFLLLPLTKQKVIWELLLVWNLNYIS